MNLHRMYLTCAVLTAMSAAGVAQAQSPSTDSVSELSWNTVERIIATTRAIEQAGKGSPSLPLRLPLDPQVLAQAIARNPRVAGIPKSHGLTTQAYARDFTRLVTAVFGVAVANKINNGESGRVPPSTRWSDTLRRETQETGAHLTIRVKRNDAWSDWIWIQQRDALFARQHQSSLAAAGFGVSKLGLTDQQATADLISFPNQAADASVEPASGDFLDSTEAPSRSTTGRPLRVLFIGDGGSNSERYRHNEAYRLFRLIAAAGLGQRVVVGQVTRPGGRLPGLWDIPITRQVIRNLPWDYVVLQEHSNSLKEYSAQALAEAVRSFDGAAKSASARLVYTVFGPRPAAAELSAAANAVNAIVAPMFAVWPAASADPNRSVSIGAWGTGHLPPGGHYLQALVFYRAITGRSPIGLPAPPVEVGQDTTFTIPPQAVEVLQRAAATFGTATPHSGGTP